MNNTQLEPNYYHNLALCRYAYYYWTVAKDLCMAEQYYFMAISNESIFALAQVAQFYYETGKFEKAVEYISKAIQKGDKGSIEPLLAYHINESKKLDKDSLELVLPYVEELFKDEKVALYILHNCVLQKVLTEKYGVNISEKEPKECNICLENKTLFITPSCNHDICGDCFIKTIEENNTNCSFCRKRFATDCINIINVTPEELVNIANQTNSNFQNASKGC
jgi:tetratricopeptide (TPR) repeat protein